MLHLEKESESFSCMSCNFIAADIDSTSVHELVWTTVSLIQANWSVG
jgi:hypothetical protein